MKVPKLNSSVRVTWNLQPYRVKWDRKVSGPQKAVKDFLQPYWRTHAVYEEVPIPGSRLRCDLVNTTRGVVVEVSPGSSHTFNEFFHKNRVTFGNAMGRERDKHDWVKGAGLTLVEIFDDDMDLLSPEWFFATCGISL